MNVWKFRFCSILLALGAILSWSADGWGQEREKMPRQRGDQPIQKQKMQLLGNDAEAQPENHPKVETRAGVRRTTLMDGGRQVTIVENPKRGIEMQIVRYYSASQLQELTAKYPELRDYVELFPQQIEDQEIELTLALKEKVKARTLESLKRKNKAAFEIYQRHVQKHGNHLDRFPKQN